ncbi:MULTISPECIES: hypothetical protein [unclassified Janthinobacterium]|uniref:hypothetical protein n=1 Tax=unclassified Janthinobacterium TaxID=2610881 RepID=UPI0025B060E8|nr:MULTISPECIES: hypothetical protein [unclassified Janthinobacterium]MDN2716960.1 hypothetical protein [Janthinobacterium sp. SUN120]MDO8050095.1 hypothetical protein [Janthinobacterium sp. SUN211]
MSALVKLVRKVPGWLYGALLLCLLAGAALHGLAMIFREGFKDKKAGIMLMICSRIPSARASCLMLAGTGLNQCGRWLPLMR